MEGSAISSTSLGCGADSNNFSPIGGETPGVRSSLRMNAELELTLEHAEHLLNYAIEAGIEVDAEVVEQIITAKRLGPAIWDGPDGAALIAAITKLAAKLRPVTAETLRACRVDAPKAIRIYKRVAYVLAAVIIPMAVLSSIFTSISTSITADISAANNLTLTLHKQLESPNSRALEESAPPESLSDLQQFAVLVRAVYGRARQLNPFVPFVHSKKTLSYADMQLPPNLKNTTADLQKELENLTGFYQDVRLYATNVQDYTSFVWGALSASLLPVLYALLGACAYVLRTFTEQFERRTFAPSYATPARFVIAAIGGGVVGLFSNTFGQSASSSPLAVAFLIGYATDVFFSLLESNLRGGKAQ